MQLIFLSILGTIFFYLNAKILSSDVKEKIIPNKLLVILIFVWIIFITYNVVQTWNIAFLLVTMRDFLLSLLAWFILFYFWVWSAWDAKYISVLCLFLWNIWLVTFLWNIGLLTLIYLFLYFIYFYLYKFLTKRTFRNGLLWNIKNDLKEQIIWKIKNVNGSIDKEKAIIKVLKVFVNFLIAFTAMRLGRMYFTEYIKTDSSLYGYFEYILKIFWTYKIHSILLTIGISFLIMYVARYISVAIKKWLQLVIKFYILRGKILPDSFFEVLYLVFITVSLWSFLLYEYSKNPDDIIKKIYVIFTVYLWIYIIFKILYYAMKVTFQISEQHYIKIPDLKSWEILDKPLLIQLLWNQQKHLDTIKSFKDFDIQEFLSHLENPISEEDTKKLKEVFQAVNNYHKRKKTPWFNEMIYIKTLHTFAFAWYIFFWFLVTFFLKDSLFNSIINTLLNIWKTLYQTLF